MILTFNKEISRKIRFSIHYDQEILKAINNTHIDNSISLRHEKVIATIRSAIRHSIIRSRNNRIKIQTDTD